MLFNSVEYFLFLPIVFVLYWFVVQRNLRLQNWLLLLASYVFYGWWDWRFLTLIAFSTGVDFLVGLSIEAAKDRPFVKRAWLGLSLVVNLGLLGYFKYANFFIDSWVDAWSSLGIGMNVSSLNIILPVGISFYTFQTLSYSIDVYRGQLKPTRDILAFAAFVSFFPQLVAGPIERASALLPQIEHKREFNYQEAVSGLRLIVWGMYKKVVVADTCARLVDRIFSDYNFYPGPILIFGAILFAFQIYGDFSGYSDIAIGTARLFGIRLMTNFKFPYFSRDISEFWRRWHISLSTWFRDYLYIPLGGSRVGRSQAIRNVFIIFIVSGLWHGSNWTFVVWGAIFAVLFMPLFLTGKNRLYTTSVVAEGKLFPSLREMWQMLSTFTIVTVAWVFFRADSVAQAIDYISRWPILPSESTLSFNFPLTVLLYIGITISIDWFSREERLQRGFLKLQMQPLRWTTYGLAIWMILRNLQSHNNFIYFQF